MKVDIRDLYKALFKQLIKELITLTKMNKRIISVYLLINQIKQSSQNIKKI